MIAARREEPNAQLSRIACNPSPVVIEGRIDDELDAAREFGRKSESVSPSSFEVERKEKEECSCFELE